MALLSLLQATLTLPGIAAIALTLGMAIDSNVLINERIREELRNGASPQAAIHAGYERAFGTILDSNVTTLIAGLALLIFGSGPIRGFAVVHCLGIMTSIFSVGGDLARGRQSDLRLAPPAGETGDREQLLEMKTRSASHGIFGSGRGKRMVIGAPLNFAAEVSLRQNPMNKLRADARLGSQMEFFKIRKDIPFMRHALVFNVISLITFLLAVFFLATGVCTTRSNSPAAR